jgi:rifampicin phosphotransferase
LVLKLKLLLSQEIIQNRLEVGGKAYSLAFLSSNGFRVPAFSVVQLVDSDQMLPALSEIEDFINKSASRLPDAKLFAVRSSASNEDGTEHSFAGMFESVLNVSKDHLAQAVLKVFQSLHSDRIQVYSNNTQSARMNVIIQVMLNPDFSGVAFGMDPLSGRRDRYVINSVKGLGNGLVSGEVNADYFEVEKGTIVAKRWVDPSSKEALGEAEILQVSLVLTQLKELRGRPQDIEFCFEKGVLFLVQSRPITQLHKKLDPSGERCIWDNSNIIESYPGISSPLTFSFVSKSYKGAYTLFSKYLGVSNAVVQNNEEVFLNTLGYVNGRIYYNLKSWYLMLALLPGYRINARFMEQMMGVKEKFDLPKSESISLLKAYTEVSKVILMMLYRFAFMKRIRDRFVALLESTLEEYNALSYSEMSAHKLMNAYRQFERKLLNEWKAPLLNDLFAMISFGMLKKQCDTLQIPDFQNIHNDLLCGSQDILSVEPIHRTLAIVYQIEESDSLMALFRENSAEKIWSQLRLHPNLYPNLFASITSYLKDFGDRCMGELKLETTSYSQQPSLFIQVVQSYVRKGISKNQFNGERENEIRFKAEEAVKQATRRNPLKRIWFNAILRKTRDLVSARENLRYERTRAFGIVRKIFHAMGKLWYANHLIENEKDIFFLAKEEIFEYIEGRSTTRAIKALIELRKAEKHEYEKERVPSERFTSFGIFHHGNDFFQIPLSETQLQSLDGKLQGIGCSPGRVRARVRVIYNPEEADALNGDILVTRSTDPGWVILFPSAAGILVERGSLLSHSAIVSREMGIPCIVGISSLLKELQTGDWVEMDGANGTVFKIERP